MENSECGTDLYEDTERRVKDESEQYSSHYDEEVPPSSKGTSQVVDPETSESKPNSTAIRKAEADILQEDEELKDIFLMKDYLINLENGDKGLYTGQMRKLQKKDDKFV